MFLSTVAGVLIAASSASTPSADSPAQYLHPHWTQKPTGNQLGDVYPSVAQRRGVAGRVMIACAPSGAQVVDCKVIPGTETPEGYGFGESALKISQYFRMAPESFPSGGIIAIPVTWKTDNSGDPLMSAAEEKLRLDWLRSALNTAGEDHLVEPIFPKPDRGWPAFGPLGRWFPERAARSGVAGMAVMRCKVAPEQKLTDCVTLGDAPLEFGFGSAAGAMAKDGYMRAPVEEPVGTVIRVVVKFPKAVVATAGLVAQPPRVRGGPYTNLLH